MGFLTVERAPCPEALGSVLGLPVSMPRPLPGWRAAVECRPASAIVTGPTWSGGRWQDERALPGAPGGGGKLRTCPREVVEAGLYSKLLHVLHCPIRLHIQSAKSKRKL